MFDVDANLFRLAYLATSTEETRYYLMGVYLEPCAHGGALLVATNGHVALVLRDPVGVVETPVIVRATKPTLTACRSKNSERRRLRGDMAENPIRVDMHYGADPKPAQNLALQSDWRVDGTFPDWRRVLPVIPAGATLVTGCYKASNLAMFGEVARGLGVSDGITVASTMIGNPALVRWHGDKLAEEAGFGIIMPVRMDTELVGSYPEWIR